MKFPRTLRLHPLNTHTVSSHLNFVYCSEVSSCILVALSLDIVPAAWSYPVSSRYSSLVFTSLDIAVSTFQLLPGMLTPTSLLYSLLEYQTGINHPLFSAFPLAGLASLAVYSFHMFSAFHLAGLGSLAVYSFHMFSAFHLADLGSLAVYSLHMFSAFPLASLGSLAVHSFHMFSAFPLASLGSLDSYSLHLSRYFCSLVQAPDN